MQVSIIKPSPTLTYLTVEELATYRYIGMEYEGNKCLLVNRNSTSWGFLDFCDGSFGMWSSCSDSKETVIKKTLDPVYHYHVFDTPEETRKWLFGKG